MHNMGYQRYTKEFKDKAIELCLQPDANRQKIADSLGVKYNTIYNCTVNYAILNNYLSVKNLNKNKNTRF